MKKNPIDIQFKESKIHIQWNDLSVSEIGFYALRCACPCAYCEDEFTGERILKPEDVSSEIKPTSAELVGAYAMQIKWSDGHSAGIYTWDFLDSLSNYISSVGTDTIST